MKPRSFNERGESFHQPCFPLFYANSIPSACGLIFYFLWTQKLSSFLFSPAVSFKPVTVGFDPPMLPLLLMIKKTVTVISCNQWHEHSCLRVATEIGNHRLFLAMVIVFKVKSMRLVRKALLYLSFVQCNWPAHHNHTITMSSSTAKDFEQLSVVLEVSKEGLLCT